MSTRNEYLISAYGLQGGNFELDTAILDAVAAGKVTFSAICEHLGKDTVRPSSQLNDWRAIDRRLQWLRKKRFLIFIRGEGWKTLPPEKSAGAA